MSDNLHFSIGDCVVYPAHGVGRVHAIENKKIKGQQLSLYVINFENSKMTLRVPIEKLNNSGLRRLSSIKQMNGALLILKGRARLKRVMWARRAQEYGVKINSGNPVLIAEVVRDLYRTATQNEQSFSERQIYEAAFKRLSDELSAVENIEKNQAAIKIVKFLEKSVD